jgi:hypothetical protein
MSANLVDATIRNLVVTGTLALPAGSLTNSHIAAGADIATSKLVHRHVLNYHQASGAAMADATVPLFIGRYTTGLLVAVEAAILVAAVGDSTVTIDLQKSTGGGAFATVLTATIDIDSTTVVRTVLAGTLDSTSFTAGDIYQLVIDATAGTGTLPQGLNVTVTIDETAA